MTRRPIPFVCRPAYNFSSHWLNDLRAAMPDEEIIPLGELSALDRASCDVAIVADPQPSDLITLPALKWVHSVWAGVEKLVAELPGTNFEIVRLVDPRLASTMAEAVLAWTLYLHRDMPRYASQQAVRWWLPHEYVPASRRTVSLLGLGALGAAAAQKLLASEFRVCGWSRTNKAMRGIESFVGECGLKRMIAETDILVCLLPLTDETRGILGAAELNSLPSHASLINFARGPIVDDQALREALDSGRLEHAVLDVFDREPLDKSAWQWEHPRVTVLPHISAPTDRESASAIVGAAIRKYREDGLIPKGVDREIGY